MYNTFTSSKLVLISAMVAATLLSTTPVFAGKGQEKAPGKPGDDTIVGLAIGTDDFSALVEAILCFGPVDDNAVVDLLSGNRPFTVFAPNNDAFDTFLNGADPCSVDSSLLFAVLTYHVTPGRRYANSVFDVDGPKMIEMFSGDSIIANSDFTITGLAEQKVTLGDLINVKASNGVIHEINAVLDPRPPEQ